MLLYVFVLDRILGDQGYSIACLAKKGYYIANVDGQQIFFVFL